MTDEPPRPGPPSDRPASDGREAAAAEQAGAEVEVDTRGLACPLPVVELAKAVDSHPVGTRFRLRSTDPGAKVDIPVWCRMTRQELLSEDHTGDEHVFVVEKVRAT